MTEASKERAREASRRWRAENVAASRESTRRWRAENADQVRRNKKAWYEKNRERAREANRKWRDENRDYCAKKRRINYALAGAASARQWRRDNPERALINAARDRARRKGLDFSLTVADVSIPEMCPVLGVRLSEPGTGKFAPSIDRIDNSRGYTPDNIQVISRRANMLKSNASLAELQKLLAFVTLQEERKTSS